MANKVEQQTALVQAIVHGAILSNAPPKDIGSMLEGLKDPAAEKFADRMAHHPAEPVKDAAALVQAVGRALTQS